MTTQNGFPNTHGTAFGWEWRVLTITRSRLLVHVWSGPYGVVCNLLTYDTGLPAVSRGAGHALGGYTYLYTYIRKAHLPGWPLWWPWWWPCLTPHGTEAYSHLTLSFAKVMCAQSEIRTPRISFTCHIDTCVWRVQHLVASSFTSCKYAFITDPWEGVIAHECTYLSFIQQKDLETACSSCNFLYEDSPPHYLWFQRPQLGWICVSSAFFGGLSCQIISYCGPCKSCKHASITGWQEGITYCIFNLFISPRLYMCICIPWSCQCLTQLTPNIKIISTTSSHSNTPCSTQNPSAHSVKFNSKKQRTSTCTLVLIVGWYTKVDEVNVDTSNFVEKSSWWIRASETWAI